MDTLASRGINKAVATTNTVMPGNVIQKSNTSAFPKIAAPVFVVVFLIVFLLIRK